MNSPIAVFLYNRPDKTFNCLKSISLNNGFKNSPLYIFIDGPKNKKDIVHINRIIEIIEEFNFENLEDLVISNTNLGLANSIYNGVQSVLNKHETIIVLEDDLIFSKYFLDFMNKCLEKYQSEDIYQISGYVWGDSIKRITQKPFLIPNINSWGWATWRSRWEGFELDKINKQELAKFNPQLVKKFNLSRSYDYFKILKNQIKGNVDSWAIQWYYHVFKNKGFTIYPPSTLVVNKGMDGSGTHTLSSKFNKKVVLNMKFIFPKTLSFEKDIFELFCRDLKEANTESLLKKILIRVLHFQLK